MVTKDTDECVAGRRKVGSFDEDLIVLAYGDGVSGASKVVKIEFKLPTTLTGGDEVE